MARYLRDMGGTALLTREGEAALAKRIEAGRRAVLDGLCGSLPTVQAVSAWRDAVRGGSLALRVMIDVEATHGGGRHRYGRADAEAPEHEQEGTDGSGSGRPGLSTMETAVLPRAMETLNAIAASCAKLRRLQEQRIELARKNRTLAASQERRRHALQRDLATSIRSLRLTSARIEVVVDDPRVASERLRWCEGAPLRMAIECGVPREAFLKQHEGREHQSGWLSRVGRPRGGGWKTLAAVKRPQLLALRREILTLARETTTVPVDLKAERRDGPWWRARGAAGHRRDDRG